MLSLAAFGIKSHVNIETSKEQQLSETTEVSHPQDRALVRIS
jgi:hypothetical protein